MPPSAIQYLGSLPFLFVGGILLQFWCLTIPFLALGGWFNPGNQWTAIGITLLTAATLSMITLMSHFIPDPGWRGGRTPDTSKLWWRIGFANLALIYAAGLALSWLGHVQGRGV